MRQKTLLGLDLLNLVVHHYISIIFILLGIVRVFGRIEYTIIKQSLCHFREEEFKFLTMLKGVFRHSVAITWV
jgi:hypothetical protein